MTIRNSPRSQSDIHRVLANHVSKGCIPKSIQKNITFWNFLKSAEIQK